MVDENTDELRISNSRGISYSFSRKFLREVRGKLLPRLLLKQETIVLSEEDPACAEVRLEHDFKTACLAPVIHHQRAVGYLHCDRAAPAAAFSPEEIRRLEVVRSLIGLILEKFDLLELTRHLERIDNPSKALKYHAFLAEYYRERARAKTYRLPLSLLFVDIDHYPAFVATCGIQAGHALLDEVRRLIAECLRPMDLIGRFSADQFLVCLGGMNRTEAAATLEAIRQRVQESAGRAAGSPVTITGVALAFENPEDFEAPLAKVLAALGSGMLTAQTQDGNHILTIDPPRK
jgi:diguanylate cyclase (GGDEF)-like protein